ncbi:membrane protein insertase YidC [Paenibacillus sp. GCM10023248]|uniref:membrane protein insertase YidC n=1 Tax=Bacillales TaxID=1385 RepID=UPI002379BAEA|nr:MULTISPECIES: membrane protein insertase YidC [Bacillales]MDD9270853.1 membrane protein insertase YidC [Paenibacillus sp. MAHUQ-63]MDR6883236.1 YidC/Oxa1 family membrane protein insertase [Bacillus sp. 3255]
MTRRIYMLAAISAMILLLSGCSPSSSAMAPIDLNTANFFTKYFVYPLSETLDWFADHLWGQYGLSILVVTIIIRLIILPLTLKQYKSSKRMQELQPEMKKLKEKYKDDAKKQQEETMKLFQQNGVNPLAGCFPIIVQMPILIALYQAIMRNQEIHGHNFLWMNLGQPDHYYILPLIAAATTFVQQMFMSSQMNQQMKSLLYIFPVMIFVMSMNFAAALPLYWIYGNIFTIVQSYFIYGSPGKQKNPGSQNNKGGLSK